VQYVSFTLALTGALAINQATFGQATPEGAQPMPRLLTIMPLGGKIGTDVEVTLGGTDIEDPEKLLFNHPGIKAEPIIPPDPPAPAPGKPAPPKPGVTKFKVTIPADVPIGIYDVRVANKWGVSNPRAFVLGDINEVLEKEPNNDVQEAQRVELNTTINGSIAAPTDVDYFVFTAKKGQRIVLSCLASSVDSRLHAGLEVYDAKGKLITSNRNYNRYDALCDLMPTEDGDFHVRLFEFTHTQGTPEHFYRLTIGTAPWIEAVHPCVLEPGKPTQVTIYGRNLPGGKPEPGLSSDDAPLEKITVTITPPVDSSQLNYSGFLPPSAAQLEGFEYRIKNDTGWSNPFLLTFARAPLVVDSDAVKTPEMPQAITVPCEIAGHLEKARARDWYQFNAKKGETYNIELLSDRLGAPAFMYFQLKNGDGKQAIMESADSQNMLNLKFYTRNEDPQPYKFTVPADGKYLLLVSSRTADRVFGPRQYYRLRITPDQPDFQLVVMAYPESRPDGNTLGQGGSLKLDVLAWRHEGLNSEIALSVEGLPPGISCPPQSIGPNQRQAPLVLTAAADAAAWTGAVKIKGTTTFRGQKIEREARSGTIVWPVQPGQGIPTVSRLDRQTVLAVREKPAFTLTTSIDKPMVTQGTPAQITVKVARNSPELKNPIAVQASPADVPQGLLVNNNQPINVAADKSDATLPVAVPPGILPGTYTIVLHGSTQIPFNKDPKGPKQPINFVEFSTPVTLNVLPKSVAALALANPAATAKAGATTDYVLKLTRQFDYDGEFKVEVVVPAAVKDVSVAAVTVPPGQNEAKLPIAVPADAPPGNRADLVVKATAMYHGMPIVHEVKFNVNVVK
jgi:hypothetical protein